MPTVKPTFNVLVMALRKLPMAKIRWKMDMVRPPSLLYTLSTSSTARGYRMNSVRKVMSTTMVVTMMGSAISFFRSREAPWRDAICALLLSVRKEKREDGGENLHPPAIYRTTEKALLHQGSFDETGKN